MIAEAEKWTIAWRRRTANRFQRATNWSGTWRQAVNLAAAFGDAHPDLSVWYVATAAYDAQVAEAVAAGLLGVQYLDDIGNVMVDSGKRIKIRDNGVIEAELVGVTYCAKCYRGDQGDSLTGPKPCPECDGGVIR